MMSKQRLTFAAVALGTVAVLTLLVTFEGRVHNDTGRSEFAPQSTRPAVVNLGPPTGPTSEAGETRTEVLEKPDPKPQVVPNFVREDLYGIVLDDSNGLPIAGASVLVFPEGVFPNVGDRCELALSTDASGRFRQPNLGTCKTRNALVHATGYLLLNTKVLTGSDTEIRVRPALSFAGRVLHAADRTPVAGAEVRVKNTRWDTERLVVHRVPTDGMGSFRISGVPPDERLIFRVCVPGRLDETHQVQIRSAAVEGYDILLREATTVSLRLVDLGTGVPLGGFRARILEGSSFETDGAGIAAIAFDPVEVLSNGAVSLEVEAKGYCTTQRVLSETTLQNIHDVPMTRGSRIEGLVRTATGNPLEGTEVSFDSGGSPWLHSPDEVRGSLAPGTRISTPQRPPVETDAEGRFELEALFVEYETKTRTPEVLARDPVLRRISKPVNLPAPGGSLWVDLVFHEPAGLRGRVTTGGKALAGARIRATPVGSLFAWTRSTNDEGEYQFFGMPGGETRVSVDGPRVAMKNAVSIHGYLHQATVFLEETSWLEHNVELEDNPTATIEGVVHRGDGTPIENVLVFARQGGFMFGLDGFVSGLGHIQTKSAKDGHFVLETPDDGVLREIVARQAGFEASVDVAPGTHDLELVVPEKGKLLLSATNAENQPIDVLSVVLLWPAGTPRTSAPQIRAYRLIPDSSGTFELSLPVGRWDLQVRTPKHVPENLENVLVPGSGQAPNRVVRFQRGAVVEVHFETTEAEGLPPIEGLSLRPSEELAWKREDPMIGFLFSFEEAQSTLLEDVATFFTIGSGHHELVGLPSDWAVEPVSIKVSGTEKHTVRVRCYRTK